MSIERVVYNEGHFDFGGTVLEPLTLNGDRTSAYEGNGEALYVSGDAEGTIQYLSIYECYAANGGAIAVDAAGALASHPVVNINDVSFMGNRASGNGGAIYAAAGTVSLSNGIFVGNSATSGLGGAIYATGASTILNINGIDFQNGYASQGGAIYLDGIGSCEISGSRFLTFADSIYIDATSSVTFSGVNSFCANVTVDVSSSVATQANAKLVFGNSYEITFDATLGADNTIELNNSAKVTLSKGIDSSAAIIVNAGGAGSQIGSVVDILTASGLTENTLVTYKGSSDTIANHNGLQLDANTDTLSAAVTFYGRVASENLGVDDYIVTFAEPDDVYAESFTEVVAGGMKEIIGFPGDESMYPPVPAQPEKIVVNGNIFASDYYFSMSDLTYGGHIYGGSKIESASVSMDSSNLILDGIALSSTTVLKIHGGGQISAPSTDGDAQTVVSREGDMLSIGLVGTKKAGTVYGGAEILSNEIVYNAGTIDTTVNSGYFGKIVGNGSTGNYGGIINQRASTLTIHDGTFYGRVYAGGYASSDAANEEANMAVSEIVGDVSLNINGGHFKDYVYGGSCAQYDYLADNNTHIAGDVTITINSSENVIKFDTAVFGGSQSEGRITGNTKIVFNGSGENLDFSKCEDGFGRFYGGSQNERDYASVAVEDYAKYVTGDRALEFSGFSGTIHADFYNFDTVSFTDSEVVWDVNADLHLVDTWNFDLSTGVTNLNWTASEADNSFAGDTINLNGWDGQTTCTFMTGSDAALSNFDKANINVYDGAGGLIESGYEVSRVNNALQIAKA